MFYVYEDHLSGMAFVSEVELDFEDRYCEQCGDSDWLLETFKTREEAEKYVKEYNKDDNY